MNRTDEYIYDVLMRKQAEDDGFATGVAVGAGGAGATYGLSRLGDYLGKYRTRQAIKKNVNKLKRQAQGKYIDAKVAIDNGLEAFGNTMHSAIDSTRSGINSAGNAIKGKANDILNSTRSGINSAGNAIKGRANDILNSTRSGINSAGNAIKSSYTKALNTNAVKGVIRNRYRLTGKGLGALLGAVGTAYLAKKLLDKSE